MGRIPFLGWNGGACLRGGCASEGGTLGEERSMKTVGVWDFGKPGAKDLVVTTDNTMTTQIPKGGEQQRLGTANAPQRLEQREDLPTPVGLWN